MSERREPSLTIVIPALNEEDAIKETIVRCVAAREHIISEASISCVEIIVVSDGSTDRTAEIAQGFEDVRTIVFPVNRGYGAAIKEGWRIGSGDLVGFLDADGTCDPMFFVDLCKRSLAEKADVVLGSRLGEDSQMPKIRRLGNRIYAFLLGLLCGQHITDTASGMRVVNRASLKILYPLPDGLHFTPSMSARALLNNLRVIEIPMRYEERIGTSKLNVLRDGIRFLNTIFDGVLCFRPEKPLLAAFLVCAVGILLLGLTPLEQYLSNGFVQEWMIYRFAVCSFLGSAGLLTLLAVGVTAKMAHFGPRRQRANSFWAGLISMALSGRSLFLILIALFAMSIWSLWPGLTEYFWDGTVSLHWSRLMAGAFGLLSMVQTAVFALLCKVVDIWRYDEEAVSREPAPGVVKTLIDSKGDAPFDARSPIGT